MTTAEIEALIPPADVRPGYAKRPRFAKVGRSFVATAARQGLQPNHHVLDLGCGVGRFAVAFAAFVDDQGSYEGLDASAESIATCNRYIAPSLERFRFQVADVFNSLYRPDADTAAAAYAFPFRDDEFDFVFSNSLFTHLTRPDLENYLCEIGRVLRPGGRTLNTMFLLNAESLAGIESGESRQVLPHTIDGGIARVKDPARPEAVIAYDEAFVRDAYARAGLRIEDPVRYGRWSGREPSGPGFGPKDIVVAVRD